MMQLSAPVYQLKRRAKLLVRNENIPLHVAQDRIAREEGFAAWSLLVSRMKRQKLENKILAELTDGDMFLLGARPGHGKTLLGLQFLLDAARQDRRAVFFTLEYNEQDAMERMKFLGENGLSRVPEIVASDEICADFITSHLVDSPHGTVAIVDYLQILDQQRSKPSLSEQLSVLKNFAQSTGVMFGFISQIDRSFDPKRASVPEFSNLRLPNPIPENVFSKAYFLHDGEFRQETLS